MNNNRRDFLKKGTLLSLLGFVSNVFGKAKIDAIEQASKHLLETPAFSLPPLLYGYNALEPFIDAQTMEIHYGKHHKGYVDKLNGATTTNIDFQLSDAEKCKKIDATTLALVRNNLGGHYNHSLFWTLLKPNPKGEANVPIGKLANQIVKEFKSFDNFKKEFSENALKIFGSGWCWLIYTEGELKITSTPNQDNPLMKVAAMQGSVVLALDVWEHAYYLKHQNKRMDYITAWWNVVNWEKAEELFTTK
jgi:superoxide dismutase, Fe-Mn family